MWLERSNEAPKTESGGPKDHRCRPNDPQALWYKEALLRWVFSQVLSFFELWAASIVSNDNGACWPEWLLFVINLSTSYKY